jgi:hypothetical protein
MTELSFFFWLKGIFPVEISSIVIPNAYISLLLVNKGRVSAAFAFWALSAGFMISGAVHLQAPAVLMDVNSDGSMINAKP